MNRPSAYVAPLSIPTIVGTYLIQQLNDERQGGVKVQWHEQTQNVDQQDIWQVSVAGVELKTRERTSVESGIADDTVDPNLVDPSLDLHIVISQASGYSFPKWGLDYNRLRVHTMDRGDDAPAMIAEDMLERIKMALNSISGLEIWRRIQIEYHAQGRLEPVRFDYDLQRFLRIVNSIKPIDVHEFYRVINSLHVLVGNDKVGRPDPRLYEHVANWASTILDGSTIIQRVTAKAGNNRFVAYSIDFLMYIELLSSKVLGYRQAFVDQAFVSGPLAACAFTCEPVVSVRFS